MLHMKGNIQAELKMGNKKFLAEKKRHRKNTLSKVTKEHKIISRKWQVMRCG